MRVIAGRPRESVPWPAGEQSHDIGQVSHIASSHPQEATLSSSPAGRIEVNLAALLSFATDLQSHLELTLRDIGDIGALQGAIADIASCGDFPEGRELAARHSRAMYDVQDLLEEVRDVLAFADDISLWVATKYSERDRSTANELGTVQTAVGV